VTFQTGRWCDALGNEKFDLIASNPPYIAEDDPHLHQGDVRFEPRSALVSGPDGLADIQQIARQARQYLRAGGWLLLEHGFAQGAAVRSILRENGYEQVTTWHDLAGHERVTGGQSGG